MSNQTLVYTIFFAVPVGTELTPECDVLDHLREYGAADVIAVRAVNKDFDKVTVADAPMTRRKKK